MTQAGQFTPVQILEAGQRAAADGRHDYAAQFFQHLIDHYGSSPEAASAREAIAALQGQTGDAPRHVNGHGGDAQTELRAQPRNEPRPPSLGAATMQGAPKVQGPGPAQANGSARLNGTAAAAEPTPRAEPQFHGNGAPAMSAPGLNGHEIGQPQAHQPPPAPRSITPQYREDPPFGEPAPPPGLPRTVQPPGPAHEGAIQGRQAHARTAGQRRASEAQPYLPAPEKNYITGRVIAGLLLMIGILGIFAGIVFIYAAITDPKIFAVVGLTEPGQPIFFAIGVFVGSMAMLIAAQVATAIFNGADAMTDVARLQRYRAGDDEDDA